MIEYTHRRDPLSFIWNTFQWRGSVFPSSIAAALPCAMITLALKVLAEQGVFPVDEVEILQDASIWSGFVVLVSFLAVFRSSQAYHRFQDGCTAMHKMRAEWFDACSLLVSFCKVSKADAETTTKFKHTLVRLISLLHAVALAEIEDSESGRIKDIEAFRYEVFDIDGFDDRTLRHVQRCHAKVELVYQWLQQLVVESVETGVLCIAPPLLSRFFHEAANGMVQYHEARKISKIPFPFPYAQSCDCFLLIHLLVTPLVVSQWVENAAWATLFAFIQVFILWCLRNIAIQIENPFGHDENDLDAASAQQELNQQLMIIISSTAERTPPSWEACLEKCMQQRARTTLSTVWADLEHSMELEPQFRMQKTASFASSSGSWGCMPARRKKKSNRARRTFLQLSQSVSSLVGASRAQEKDPEPTTSAASGSAASSLVSARRRSYGRDPGSTFSTDSAGSGVAVAEAPPDPLRSSISEAPLNPLPASQGGSPRTSAEGSPVGPPQHAAL